MKIQSKTLRPISLALPTLLAASSMYAAWVPSGNFSGAGFSATADTTGFAQAKYDQSGVSIWAHKDIWQYYRGFGWQHPVNWVQVSGTLIVVSSIWSENSYSYGSCYLQRDDNGDYGSASVSSTI
jgi:hypothetical protein